MTRYFTRMTLELFAQLQSSLHCDECAQEMRTPEGWRITRLIRFCDERSVDLEVEDEGADPALEGLTVTPWFQHTVDGQVEIIDREVMELEHNQIHMDQTELETGENPVSSIQVAPLPNGDLPGPARDHPHH